MAAWTLFYPDVQVEVRLAPLPLIDKHLRDAAIELCDRSKVWVQTLDLIDAVAEQQAYALPLATGTELVEIRRAWFNDEPINPRSKTYLDRKYDDWTAEIGTPIDYTQDDKTEILLVPAPQDAATDAIKVRVAIKPTYTASSLDDDLFAEYRKVIACGAIASLMAMKDVAWSDPARSEFHAGKFEAGISKATTAASDGHVRARPRFSGSFC